MNGILDCVSPLTVLPLHFHLVTTQEMSPINFAIRSEIHQRLAVVKEIDIQLQG